jgi:hypothetical protein
MNGQIATEVAVRARAADDLCELSRIAAERLSPADPALANALRASSAQLRAEMAGV